MLHTVGLFSSFVMDEDNAFVLRQWLYRKEHPKDRVSPVRQGSATLRSPVIPQGLLHRVKASIWMFGGDSCFTNNWAIQITVWYQSTIFYRMDCPDSTQFMECFSSFILPGFAKPICRVSRTARFMESSVHHSVLILPIVCKKLSFAFHKNRILRI